jgi:hypothetical protein
MTQKTYMFYLTNDSVVIGTIPTHDSSDDHYVLHKPRLVVDDDENFIIDFIPFSDCFGKEKMILMKSAIVYFSTAEDAITQLYQEHP